MSDNDNTIRHEAPTRRDTIKYGGTVIGGGLLAGCLGQSGDGSASTTSPTESDAGGETATETDSSYTASIVPAGEIQFEDVPESWLAYNGGWADMAFALGQRDGFLTAGNMIPGFFFDPFDLDVPSEEELTELANWEGGGWSKEVFYELEPDVILMDPNYMHGTGWDDDWDESDTQEIKENVAPFFGNNCRRRREFHDYKLYSLYGAFERLSEAFQQQERYEAFATLHEEVQSEIQSRLPPESERPQVGLINGGSEPSKGKFYPLDTQDEGYEMKPYRDLDVASAFPDSMEGGQIDYEQLLEVDPEIIVVHWGIGTTGDTDSFSAAAFREQYVTPMGEDAVAQQLYPEEFGAFEPDSFPEVPAENQLFERERVTSIVTGER